jgi:hypothetical protein
LNVIATLKFRGADGGLPDFNVSLLFSSQEIALPDSNVSTSSPATFTFPDLTVLGRDMKAAGQAPNRIGS